MPSAKYAFALSSLKFANGRTAMLFSGIDDDAASASVSSVRGTSREDVRAFLSNASVPKTISVPIDMPMVQRLRQTRGGAATRSFFLAPNFLGAAELPNSSV